MNMTDIVNTLQRATVTKSSDVRTVLVRVPWRRRAFRVEADAAYRVASQSDHMVRVRHVRHRDGRSETITTDHYFDGTRIRFTETFAI